MVWIGKDLKQHLVPTPSSGRDMSSLASTSIPKSFLAALLSVSASGALYIEYIGTGDCPDPGAPGLVHEIAS